MRTNKQLLVGLALIVFLFACSTSGAVQQVAQRTPATTALPSQLTPPASLTAEGSLDGSAMTVVPATPTAAQTTVVPALTPVSAQTHATVLPPGPGDELTMPPGLPAAQVVEIIDGDTADVQVDGEVVLLRLIGIDTPESVHPSRPVECFGREAAAKAWELLSGQTVFLEGDPTQDERDRYGRLLRYVWLPDGRMFNYEMIAQGYAFEYTFRVPYIYQAQFRQAERVSREAGRGLWAPNTCAGQQIPADQTPGASPTLVAPAGPTEQATDCDPAYPDVCIPPPPPDLNCRDVPARGFTVLPPDPHNFDGNGDGIGCG